MIKGKIKPGGEDVLRVLGSRYLVAGNLLQMLLNNSSISLIGKENYHNRDNFLNFEL